MAIFMRQRLPGDAFAIMVLAVAGLFIGHWRVPGPRVAALNIGPNDAAYLRGFTPRYEIEDGVGVHWTTYDASVELPLVVRGPFELSYRFQRILPQTAQVRVSVNDAVVDRFECRGGRVLVRAAPIRSDGLTPLRIRFETDSHDRRNLGIRLDWIAAALGPGAALAQRGWAARRPFLLIVGLFLLLRWAGFDTRRAAAFVTPLPAAIAVGLWIDPLVVAHLTLKLTLSTLLVTTAAVALLRARMQGRWLIVLFLASYLLKGAGVFHPRFYYPDVQVHRKFVTEFREAEGGVVERGLAAQKKERQAYRKMPNGRGYAFPYSPVFYLPFIAALQSDEAIEDGMRHAALLAAASEVLLVFWLASLAFGAQAGIWGACLAVCSPILFSRLLYAMWPTLVGHVLDVMTIVAAFVYLRSPSRRHLVGLAVLTLLACLTYIGSIFNLGLFLLILALLDRRKLLPLLLVAAGSLALTVTLLYAPFVAVFVSEILPQAARGAIAAASPTGGVLQELRNAAARVPFFWGWAIPAMSLGGLWLARSRADAAAWNILRAYLLTFLVLTTLRGLSRGLFKDLKEMTFVAPLTALLAALLLSDLARRGRRERIVTVLVAVGIAALGLGRAAGYFNTYRSPVVTTFKDLPSPLTIPDSLIIGNAPDGPIPAGR
jgi:hypothetical protein